MFLSFDLIFNEREDYAMAKELKFNEPWILQRADPYVYLHGGWYYFTASVPAYDKIILRRSKDIAGLQDAEEVEIWKKHESGPMSEHIWAPEMMMNFPLKHFLWTQQYLRTVGSTTMSGLKRWV